MATIDDLGKEAIKRQRAVLEFINEEEEATVWEVCKHFKTKYDSSKHEAIYYGVMLDLEALGFIAIYDAVFHITCDGEAVVGGLKEVDARVAALKSAMNEDEA